MIDQVIQEIERLYSTREPDEIYRIQNDLQALQKSPHGYQLAKQLMLQSSKNCKYFSALTYSVIINGTKQFDDARLSELIAETRSYIFNLMGEFSSNLFIIRKLLSNLALLFLYNSTKFNRPIEALVTQDQSYNLSLALPQIVSSNNNLLTVLILFNSIIVEELMKVEQLSDIHSKVYNNVFGNFNTVIQYLSSIQIPYDIDLQSLDCLNSWVVYISMAESQSSVRYTDYNTDSLIRFLFNHFHSHDFNDDSIEIFNKAISVTTEILEMNPRMLNSDLKALLKRILFEHGNWGFQFINNIIFNDIHENYEDEISNFINLLTLFILNEFLYITKNLTTPLNQFILNVFVKLTDFPGKAIVDEKLSEQFLGFWEEFINVFVDDEATIEERLNTLSEEEKHLFHYQRDELCNSICKIYWGKLTLPSESEYLANKSEINYFRSNVGDFFSIIYSLLKVPFYETLTQGAIAQINDFNDNDISKIYGIESTLFILYKINEDCTFYESQSCILLPHVNNLLNNGLLQILSILDPKMDNYSIILSTIIKYISSIQFYLKSNEGTQFLGVIFELLFSIVLSDNHSLSLAASKTILGICQENRDNLIQFLPDLEKLLIKMIQTPTIDNLIRQRITNSFISIAQAIPDPNKFSPIIFHILHEIKVISQRSMQETDVNDDKLEYLLSLLACVVESGKACIISEEVEDIYTPDQMNIINSFWQEDNMNIKQMILNIIEEFSLNYKPFITNPTVTEYCCQIFKCCLNEPMNGPFKFDLPIILDYLVLKINNCDSNSVNFIFRLVETIIITNSKDLDKDTISTLVQKLFTEKLDFFGSDPDLIQAALELFTTILDRKPSLLIHLDIFKNVVINFAVEGLSAHEALIIKTCLKFWISLLSMKRGNQLDQDLIKQLMIEQNLGAVFTSKLLHAFIHTSRSSLDYYYLIFRNLISKYSLPLKNWIIGSYDPSFKHTEKEFGTFLNKIMITRGQRSANDVLKQFWLHENGLIEFNTQKY